MTSVPADIDSLEKPGSEWISLFEDLLRGLVHAMNNRLTALGAFAELAGMDGEALEIDVLRQEVARMHSTCALVSLLVSRRDSEALEVRLVLETALEIHSHHPRMRAIPCAVDQPLAVLPVRVPRWALLRVLLLLIDVAKREGEVARIATVGVRITGDDTAVRVHVVAQSAASREAARLAGLCGGKIVRMGDEHVLELLTLSELRRRERAGEC